MARRGDCVAIVRTRRDFIIGEGARERTEVELGQVTSVTREGMVKAYRPAWGDSPLLMARQVGVTRTLVLPAATISPEDALSVARAHHWPGHPDQPMPFESVEALRDALRPHLAA